jgi:hypothetical protein
VNRCAKVTNKGLKPLVLSYFYFKVFIRKLTILQAIRIGFSAEMMLHSGLEMLISSAINECDLAISNRGCDCMGCRQAVLSLFSK